MRLLTIFTILLAFLYDANAQYLERKGALGIQLRQLSGQQGILIEKVFAGTTADKLQLHVDDIIKSINGKQVIEQEDLLRLVSYWREGGDLVLSVERGGQMIKLKGQVVAKPQEKPRVGTVSYGAVRYRDGFLRTLLNKPSGVQKPPCIFLIQGFGCYSMDHYYRTTYVRMIVEGLVEKGYAVYRMEKPGIGDSNNNDQCAEIGYHDEIEAFRNGLSTLKESEDVDVENIILFGMSAGGVTASAIAAEIKVKGIVKYGSLFLSMYNTVLKEIKDQAALRGYSQSEIDADFESRQPMLYEYFINRKHPSKLAKNPEWDRLMRSGWPYWDGRYCLNRDPSFAREINDINIEETLKKAKCSVLAIHGEYDYNIPNSQWAEKTAETVNSILPGKGKFVILEGTEHGFTKVSSMEENIQLMDNGGFTNEFREANFNHKLIDIVAEWVNEITNGV